MRCLSFWNGTLKEPYSSKVFWDEDFHRRQFLNKLFFFFSFNGKLHEFACQSLPRGHANLFCIFCIVPFFFLFCICAAKSSTLNKLFHIFHYLKFCGNWKSCIPFLGTAVETEKLTRFLIYLAAQLGLYWPRYGWHTITRKLNIDDYSLKITWWARSSC